MNLDPAFDTDADADADALIAHKEKRKSQILPCSTKVFQICSKLFLCLFVLLPRTTKKPNRDRLVGIWRHLVEKDARWPPGWLR